MNNLEQAALRYAARGMRVVPLHTVVGGRCSCHKRKKCPTPGKHPRESGWQNDASIDPRVIGAWWRKWPDANIGILMGTSSGGLTVADFDIADAYHNWVAKHPDLAQSLPTVRTGRGFHVYFRWDRRTTTTLIDSETGEKIGELKASGYVVAPPSRHPTGTLYEWIIPLPDGELPKLDPSQCGFLPSEDSGIVTEKQRCGDSEKRSIRESEESQASKGGGSENGINTTIEEIIRRHAPKGPSQRNSRLFDLVRHLKWLPEYMDADSDTLEPIMQQYHKLAKPFSDTPYSVTRFDFLYAWDRAKHPPGQSPVTPAFKAAQEKPLPPEAARYDDSPQLQLLVALCCELQRLAGTGIPFLSCRDATRVLGMDPQKQAMTVHRWLQGLARDRIIRIIERGTAGVAGGKAMRFKYLGQM